MEYLPCRDIDDAGGRGEDVCFRGARVGLGEVGFDLNGVGEGEVSGRSGVQKRELVGWAVTSRGRTEWRLVTGRFEWFIVVWGTFRERLALYQRTLRVVSWRLT